MGLFKKKKKKKSWVRVPWVTMVLTAGYTQYNGSCCDQSDRFVTGSFSYFLINWCYTQPQQATCIRFSYLLFVCPTIYMLMCCVPYKRGILYDFISIAMKDLPLATHTTPCYSFVTYHHFIHGREKKESKKWERRFFCKSRSFPFWKRNETKPFSCVYPWCVFDPDDLSSLYFHNNWWQSTKTSPHSCLAPYQKELLTSTYAQFLFLPDWRGNMDSLAINNVLFQLPYKYFNCQQL